MRYSLENPRAYIDANVVGFLNVLENCRHTGVEHLVYASTSSVYGAHTNMPFSVHDGVDHPVSLYAASKKANELMAHTYSHLFGLPTTGLRFFTVYGPWGRPDMALFLFTRKILAGEPIDVFNHGRAQARLHLHRRHRGGGGPPPWTGSRRPTPPGTATKAPDPASLVRPVPALQHRQQQPGRSRALHPGCSRSVSGARPRRTSCRCRPATCPTPTRTSPISPGRRVSAEHERRGRRVALRRLVPRVPRGLSGRNRSERRSRRARR